MDPSRSPERRTRKTSVGHGSTSSGATRAALGGDAASRTSHVASTSLSQSVTAATASSMTGLSASSRRTHQFLGGDDRLILDIGARVTKAGHSGEARPRDVVWSLRHATPAERATDASCNGLLWTLDIARCRDDTQRRIVEYKLRARIKHFLRTLIYDTLTHDPKQRKVVVVENAFMPEIVKAALRDVLFGSMNVASVSFVPSHLMSAIAIGRVSALVVDVGYEQATLVPVHLWRPMTPRYLFTTSRVSAKRVSQRLRALLLHFGTYSAPAASSSFSTTATSTFSSLRESKATTANRLAKVPADLLDDDTLDLIKAKALFVGPPLDSTQDYAKDTTTSTMTTEAWQHLPPYIDTDEEDDVEWMNMLKAKYEGQHRPTTTDMVIHLPTARSSAEPLLVPASQPATLSIGSGQQDRSNDGGGGGGGGGVIIVPAWIRERAAEVLFEQHGGNDDDDECSVTDIILDALLKLPVDLRQTMARNIYIVGGTAMLPGLAHRLRLELVRTLDKAAEYARANGTKAVKAVALTQPLVGSRQRHTRQPPIPDQSFVSAQEGGVGDDSFVITDEGEDSDKARKAMHIAFAAPTRPSPYGKYAPLIALLPHVAVINDHAPRLDVNGMAVTGAAPSFAVNTAAWIGASLISSLRVDALDQMQRDEWEEAHERARQAAEATQKGAGGDRPSLGLGRGSFLGTVGGLDLGSYGPLTTGTRGKFSTSGASAANPRSPKGSAA